MTEIEFDELRGLVGSVDGIYCRIRRKVALRSARFKTSDARLSVVDGARVKRTVKFPSTTAPVLDHGEASI